MNQDIVVYLKAHDQMTEQVKKASSEVSKFEAVGNKAANGLSASWKALGVAVPLAAFAMAAKQALAIADNYTNLQSRLKLVTGSAEELAAAEQHLFEIANRTRGSYENTVDLYTRVSRATKELGVSETERLNITEKVNKALIISGTSQENAKAGLMQMTQALQGGVVRAEEYNSMMENTPRILEAVAAGYDKNGITLGQLRQKMLDGELTAEKFLEAFQKGGAGIDAEFSQMSVTVSQALTVLDNAYKDIISDANEGTGATNGIAQAVLDLAGTINENKDGIIALFSAIVEGAATAVEGIAGISRSIAALGVVAASEDKSLVDWITADKKDLKQWFNDIDTGIAFLDDRLSELADKRKDVSQSWAFTSDARKAKQDELAAIDKQIEAINKQKIAVQEAASVSQKATSETTTLYIEADKKKKKIIADEVVTVGKVAKAHVKAEKEKTEATKKEVENRNTYYERYGIFERGQIESLTDSWQVLEEGKVDAMARANDEIVEGEKETSNVMIDEWSNALESIQSSIADMIYEFDFSMDSILDIFKRMLAEIAAAIIMSGIKDLLLGQFDIGNILGGLGGLFSGGKGSSGGGVTGAGLLGDWGKVGGGLALAGGAYGLYSGAKSLSKGNIGSGALGIGLGGAAAYKGAVTLGMIESGTATGIAKGLASSLGMGSVQTAVQTGTATAISTTTPAWSGAYLASGGGSTVASGGTAAASGAGWGVSSATMSTIAAAAIPAVAALLVGKGIFDKANRPSASAEIDEYGITPDMLGQFSQGMAAVQGSILSMVPTLSKYSEAQYSAEHGILMLTSATSSIALKYNESAAAGHQWSTMLKSGVENLDYAAGAANRMGQALGYADGEINDSTAAIRQQAEGMRGLQEVMNGTLSVTQEMGSAINALGGVAGAAANKMADAGAIINGALGLARDFATWSMPGSESMENHASGGVFTKPTRIGFHQFGERGIEGLIPLPDGPDTMTKIIDRLDRIESRQSQTIIVNIAGTEVKRTINPMIDAVVAARQSSGVTGRAYI